MARVRLDQLLVERGLARSRAEASALLHGGQVEAYSEGPGHGSEFVVGLPRIEPVEQAESQSVLRVIGKVASVSY